MSSCCSSKTKKCDLCSGECDCEKGPQKSSCSSCSSDRVMIDPNEQQQQCASSSSCSGKCSDCPCRKQTTTTEKKKEEKESTSPSTTTTTAKLSDEKELRLDDQDNVKASVREYYGKRLKSSDDLATNCCTGAVDPHLRKLLKFVPEEIIRKSYGCGSPIPSGIEKLSILDLGSGTGRDCYVAAQLVGPTGHVTGVDMTDEQLAVARKYSDEFCKTIGYKTNIMEFKKGFIEDLKGAGVKGETIDLIMSNCVINLSPDKEAVMKSAFAALKNGGEMYFSDVYCDRRISDKIRKDPILWGECISGSLYVNDFARICRACGFAVPRAYAVAPISLKNTKQAELVGNAKFYSITFRVFKLKDLDADEEDYGHVAIYKGTIPDHPHNYKLDLNHEFVTSKPMLVSANTAEILSKSWLAPFFSVFGEKKTHFGPFYTPSLWSTIQKYGSDSSSCSSKPKSGGGCCG
eukprot:TRINITY_DN483_c0_g1_i1.p1 TRINITY_DN483_c0_g1~~TRINITY_DN483_c0_g1_i1.p1  ORF type:complete len:461 (+),score=153.32 TRINITY_DN483_c0_g1_i1:61-1443(+)